MGIKKNKIIGKGFSKKTQESFIDGIYSPGTPNEIFMLETTEIMNKYKECRMYIPLKYWTIHNKHVFGTSYNTTDEFSFIEPYIQKAGGLFISVYCPKNKKLNMDSWAKSNEYGGYITIGDEFYVLVLVDVKAEGQPYPFNTNIEQFETLKDMLKDVYNVKKLKKQFFHENRYDPIISTFDIYKFTPKKGAKRTKAELLSEAEELRKEIKQTKIPAVKQTEEVPKLIKQAGSKIKHNKMVSDIEKLLADMGELKSKVHPDKKISKLISEAEAIVKQKRKVKGKGIEDSLAKAMPGLIQMFSLFK